MICQGYEHPAKRPDLPAKNGCSQEASSITTFRMADSWHYEMPKKTNKYAGRKEQPQGPSMSTVTEKKKKKKNFGKDQ